MTKKKAENQKPQEEAPAPDLQPGQGFICCVFNPDGSLENIQSNVAEPRFTLMKIAKGLKEEVE